MNRIYSCEVEHCVFNSKKACTKRHGAEIVENLNGGPVCNSYDYGLPVEDRIISDNKLESEY